MGTIILGEIKTGYNSTLAIGWVSSQLDSFVENETLVLLINICGVSPPLRVAAKRYG